MDEPEPTRRVLASDEVQLQAYIEVVDGFCADLASELRVPRDLVQRKEMADFWALAFGAV